MAADTKPEAPALGALIGELAPGRIHLLTGGAGSGKSAIALQFVADGLAGSDTCAMLTAAHGSDVRSLAAALGMRVDPALRSRRLHLFRWRPAAQHALGAVAPMEKVVENLQLILRASRARRIVIDSFAPMLGDGMGTQLLAEALESLGATSLLTLGQRVDEQYDRWLEPLVQRAAAVIHLRRRGSAMEFECVSRRAAPGLRERGRFTLEPGHGLVGVPAMGRRDQVERIERTDPADAASLLLLEAAGRDVVNDVEA